MRQGKAATGGALESGVVALARGRMLSALLDLVLRANRHRAWPEKVSGPQVDPFTRHTKASQVAVYAMLLNKVCSPPASDVHRGGGHQCGEIENG